jgi:hypothetical protein
MELINSRFDNLQNELRRELDPKGVLEEEVFQALVQAAVNRRSSFSSERYKHDRAFFSALRELRAIQRGRTQRPRPVPPVSRRPLNVLNFRSRDLAA